MRPVAIFQHAVDVEPGYFQTWLDSRGIASQKIEPYRGEPVPIDPRAFSGICLMGGPMSVNDPLPWIDEELRLVRAADAAGIPIIGHCLGGQLIAKAFGAPVTRHEVKEIGWGEVQVTDHALAARWLDDGTVQSIEMFHGFLPAGCLIPAFIDFGFLRRGETQRRLTEIFSERRECNRPDAAPEARAAARNAGSRAVHDA